MGLRRTIGPRTIELWGGVECTVNRVGDGHQDQLRLSGHHDRSDDLERFAELGFAALRYPVLWERTQPDPVVPPDWSWSDARLAKLRDLGIRPIVGLVHHGSGPRDTSLLAEDFTPRLAAFAGQVAERYPWIEEWTPVNEPVTTARFSALYGHWHPHARDERSFWLALLNQIDAARGAMAAIRRVIPTAQLIQTDDLGRTFATPALAHQAEHDNARRWAGWDLLFGRIDHHHRLFERLAHLGFGDRLRAIADDPCPPDVIGVNHYLTSDRFLDDRIDRYPPHLCGGNGREVYADTEAVRVLDPPPNGLVCAIREAWERYHAPIALTEVHNGCTREEQLRWAAEAWDASIAAKKEGADIRAVTAWSLLGSQGWNTLLTGPGNYESGVFDVSSGKPRPTALASLWCGLPGGAPRHPVAENRGWWARPERLLHPRAAETGTHAGPAKRPLLICGATGTLGQAFARACTVRGIAYSLTGRDTLDLNTPERIERVMDEAHPWAVVNAAGWVRVDDAEDEEAACHRVNAAGAIALAQACASRGLPCLNISSDLVFPGDGARTLVESDPPRPLNAYGRSKAAMEAACTKLDGSLIVRTAAFFSPYDPYNFAAVVAASLDAGQPFHAAHDYVVTPTYVPSLVDAALDLLIDEVDGIWHLTAGEPVSWADFAIRVAAACGHDADLIEPVAGERLGWKAPRPRYVPLASERGRAVESLEASILRFVADRRHQREERAV